MNKDTLQSNTDWREEALDSFMGVIIANSEGLIDNGKGEGYSYAHSVYLNNIKEEFKPIISQLLEAEKKRWVTELKKVICSKEGIHTCRPGAVHVTEGEKERILQKLS